MLCLWASFANQTSGEGSSSSQPSMQEQLAEYRRQREKKYELMKIQEEEEKARAENAQAEAEARAEIETAARAEIETMRTNPERESDRMAMIKIMEEDRLRADQERLRRENIQLLERAFKPNALGSFDINEEALGLLVGKFHSLPQRDFLEWLGSIARSARNLALENWIEAKRTEFLVVRDRFEDNPYVFLLFTQAFTLVQREGNMWDVNFTYLEALEQYWNKHVHTGQFIGWIDKLAGYDADLRSQMERWLGDYLYLLDRLPDKNFVTYLKELGGPDKEIFEQERTLRAAIRLQSSEAEDIQQQDRMALEEIRRQQMLVEIHETRGHLEPGRGGTQNENPFGRFNTRPLLDLLNQYTVQITGNPRGQDLENLLENWHGLHGQIIQLYHLLFKQQANENSPNSWSIIESDIQSLVGQIKQKWKVNIEKDVGLGALLGEDREESDAGSYGDVEYEYPESDNERYSDSEE